MRRRFAFVLHRLGGEDSIAELCGQAGISQRQYYKWSKNYLGAGRKRLAGDITLQVNTTEVKELRSGLASLKWRVFPEAWEAL
ncbi:helix-turn-helix domain-containing protein [Fretibacter rubidus]|uniref:helix-turn-helix domain-containing protein n=1 Tax=Fretibacter rubidus TaxID=570162 RepID=UPI00352B4B93